MSPDPRTAPDRLRALFAEHDCIDPEALYDELVQEPQMLMDVLRCIGFVGQQWVTCSGCGAEARDRAGLVHGPHYVGNPQVVTKWSAGRLCRV